MIYTKTFLILFFTGRAFIMVKYILKLVLEFQFEFKLWNRENRKTLLTRIEAFFSQKYALFSNHCPLLPNCFLRQKLDASIPDISAALGRSRDTLAGGEEEVTKEDNNRSVAALTLVSRAAGKLDVRAGCVCGERCAGSSPNLCHVSAVSMSVPEDTAETAETSAAHRWRFGNTLYSILSQMSGIHTLIYFLVSPSSHICCHAGRISPGSGAQTVWRPRGGMQVLSWSS